jgi:hypothetical protein
MKKFFGVKLIAITGLTCLCLTGCFNSKEPINNPSGNPEIEDTVVEGNVETKVKTVLERLKITDLKKLSDEDAAKLYDIEDIEDYDIGVYVNIAENDYEEITIIKMNDKSDAEDVLMKVSARIASLHQEYKDNPEVLAILEDSKNVIIKQEGMTQTIIISKNAAVLEQKLKVQF